MATGASAVQKQKLWAGFDDVPDIDPVIAYEITDFGWRGLTGDGEVLEVRGRDGAPPTVPDSMLDVRGGVTIGRREVVDGRGIVIDEYLRHFESGRSLILSARPADALAEIDAAIAVAPTARARFNRAMVLLELGRWGDGFAEYELLERSPPFQRPCSLAALCAGVAPWRGEDLDGKRLLLIHDHGIGDAIMCLRYVPVLQACGADVAIMAPPELKRVAAQFAPVVTTFNGHDYFVSLLHLLRWIGAGPDGDFLCPHIDIGVDVYVVAQRRVALGPKRRRRVGVAWSVGKSHDGDYPRSIPLDALVDVLGSDVELISVQKQGREEAEALGVRVVEFGDVADCAALMMALDEIVTVDTAAVHIAGAIGHPNTKLLLSHWASWRWRAAFYSGVKICRQDAVGDWASALAKL